jgi:hypothetical protein
MTDPELVELIAPYIKEDFPKDNWVEKGLVDDAPLSAVLAFKEFKEIEESAKKHGIEV